MKFLCNKYISTPTTRIECLKVITFPKDTVGRGILTKTLLQQRKLEKGFLLDSMALNTENLTDFFRKNFFTEWAVKYWKGVP